MADKDADGIFAELEPLVDEVVITQSASMRSMDPADLADIARDTFDAEDVHEAASLPDAIATAVDLAEQGQADAIASGTGVIVAGSTILAADGRALFGLGNCHPRPAATHRFALAKLSATVQRRK